MSRVITSKVYLFIFFCYLIGHLGFWFFDSYVPFRVTGEPTYTEATPGKDVKLSIPVERDLEKKCSVLFSRYMYDSKGTYYDLMATRFISYKGLVELDKINPDTVKFSFTVPPSAAPGPAIVITQLAYMCNPLQAIWPMDYDMKVTVNIENKP